MARTALPSGIRQGRENFVELAEVYKQLNAPLGELGRASMVYAIVPSPTLTRLTLAI